MKEKAFFLLGVFSWLFLSLHCVVLEVAQTLKNMYSVRGTAPQTWGCSSSGFLVPSNIGITESMEFISSRNISRTSTTELGYNGPEAAFSAAPLKWPCLLCGAEAPGHTQPPASHRWLLVELLKEQSNLLTCTHCSHLRMAVPSKGDSGDWSGVLPQAHTPWDKIFSWPFFLPKPRSPSLNSESHLIAWEFFFSFLPK